MKNNNNSAHNYSDFLQKPVEVNTYLSSTPIVGEIISSDENSITIAPTFSNSGSDYYKSNFDMENTYYLPNNSIISLKEI